MSLAQLLRWHYWPIQDANSTVASDGSIDRWTTATIATANFNRLGNRQRITKDKEFDDYNIRDYRGDFILFYNGDITIQKWHRILTNIDPKKKLTQAIIDAHTKIAPTIQIMDFVGYGELVEHSKLKLKAMVLKEMHWFSPSS